MSCEQWQDDLILLALGQLDDGPEAELLRAHLRSNCSTCRDFFRDLRQSLAALAVSAPAANVHDQLWQRLESRLSDRHPGMAGEPSPNPGNGHPDSAPALVTRDILQPAATARPQAGRRRLHVRTAVWSALVGATATVLFVHVFVGRPLVLQVEQLQMQQVQQQQQIDSLSDQVHFASHSLTEMTSPFLRKIDLVSPDSSTSAKGYAIWDSLGGQLHVFLFDLPYTVLPETATSSTQRLGIWVHRLDGTLVPLDSIVIDNSEMARILPISLPPAGVAELLVTQEMDEQLDPPTGSVLLRATVH